MNRLPLHQKNLTAAGIFSTDCRRFVCLSWCEATHAIIPKLRV